MPPVKTPTPIPRLPTIKDFYTWVEGKIGLTQKEFFGVWVTPYNLTPEQTRTLEAQLKPEKPPVPPKPPPPPPPPPPPKIPRVPGELIIKRTPYPKWWKDSLNATINLTAPGSAILATVARKLRLYVATIVITVTGETVITFTFGNAGSSGPIYLGGENQPMGIVIAMGNSPAPCGQGPLTISATDPNDETPSIGGFATCFAEEG
jgi:hypothetical protein